MIDQIPKDIIKTDFKETKNSISFEVGISSIIKKTPCIVFFSASTEDAKKALASINNSSKIKKAYFNLIQLGINGDSIKFAENVIIKKSNNYLAVANGKFEIGNRDILNLIKIYFEQNKENLKITKIKGENFDEKLIKRKISKLKRKAKLQASSKAFKWFNFNKLPIGKILDMNVEDKIDLTSNTLKYGSKDQIDKFSGKENLIIINYDHVEIYDKSEKS